MQLIEEICRKKNISQKEHLTDDILFEREYPDHPLAFSNRLKRIHNSGGADNFFNQFQTFMAHLFERKKGYIIFSSDVSPYPQYFDNLMEKAHEFHVLEFVGKYFFFRHNCILRTM